MLFPRVYRGLLDEIKNGKYGEDFQYLANSVQYAAVNAVKQVYICSHCGRWRTEYVLDLYEPKNTKIISQQKYGDKTVAELGYVPCFLPWIDRDNYKLLKRFIHKCPDCGKRTHKASKTETDCLPCPKCKSKDITAGELNWD